MAKQKNTLISISKVDDIIKEQYVEYETVAWNDIEIKIKKTLSLDETMTFVDAVVGSCFVANGAEYIPEVKDFVIGRCVLNLYGNFRLPDNVQHSYNIVYCTDIVDTILKHINKNQFDSIIAAINAKIEYKIRINTDILYKQVNESVSSVENMSKQLLEIFGGVTSDDISDVVKAIGNGKFDLDTVLQNGLSSDKKQEE